jgi:hypothetical protein
VEGDEEMMQWQYAASERPSIVRGGWRSLHPSRPLLWSWRCVLQKQRRGAASLAAAASEERGEKLQVQLVRRCDYWLRLRLQSYRSALRQSRCAFQKQREKSLAAAEEKAGKLLTQLV